MEQIVDYKNDPGNGYTKTLLCFLQLFIVSNRDRTFYFANNTDLNFYIAYDRQENVAGEVSPLPPAVTFFRERTKDGDPIPIKVSRGEENIFIWCFFLAIVQLVLDGAEAYDWVEYVYVDDPISSLDENNAIAVATHLAQLLTNSGKSGPTVISTHHPLFFNVLCNELGKKAHKHFLKCNGATGGYFLADIDGQEFLHHRHLQDSQGRGSVLQASRHGVDRRRRLQP